MAIPLTIPQPSIPRVLIIYLGRARPLAAQWILHRRNHRGIRWLGRLQSRHVRLAHPLPAPDGFQLGGHQRIRRPGRSKGLKRICGWGRRHLGIHLWIDPFYAAQDVCWRCRVLLDSVGL